MRTLLYFLILISLSSVGFAAEEPTKKKPKPIEDGFFHLGVSLYHATEGVIQFAHFSDGTTGASTVNLGSARISTGSFEGSLVELVFFTPGGGFSFGYAKDAAHEVQNTEIKYSSNSTTVSRPSPNDSISNDSFLFNYFIIRTANRGYWTFGVNLSQPTLTSTTGTNPGIDLKGDMGLQVNFGLPLVKGIIFDFGLRTTGMKLKYTNADGTFENYGRGQVTNSLVGFKFIF